MKCQNHWIYLLPLTVLPVTFFYVFRCIKRNKVYEWDEFQKAWFPKVTEDFLANYQATYGSMRWVSIILYCLWLITMSDHLPAVFTDLSWKNDLPGSKAVTVLGREVTNICVCAFKVGSFGSLLSRSFFQLTWLRTAGKWPLMQEPANRHMTDSTENVVQNNFYRFFSRISAILLEQLKTRIFAHRGTRETMLKEIRIVRRSQVLLYEWRKYGKFQILGLIGVPGKGVVTQMVRVDVHESRPGLVNLDQGLFVRTRVGPFGTGPSVIFGSKILKLSFLSLKSSRTF